MVDDVLNHVPSELHIVIQVGKSDFRLDHPEFSRVTSGVRIFSAECGTEGVNVTECHSKGFAFELTRNCEVSALSEEILRPVNASILVFGQIVLVEGGYAEHFACTFGVRAGDNRCVNVNESAVVKEFVNCKSDFASDSENG